MGSIRALLGLGAQVMKFKSSIYCNHANETPDRRPCDCDADCACRQSMCPLDHRDCMHSKECPNFCPCPRSCPCTVTGCKDLPSSYKSNSSKSRVTISNKASEEPSRFSLILEESDIPTFIIPGYEIISVECDDKDPNLYHMTFKRN